MNENEFPWSPYGFLILDVPPLNFSAIVLPTVEKNKLKWAAIPLLVLSTLLASFSSSVSTENSPWEHLFYWLPELGRLLHIFTHQISIIMFFFDFLISKVTLYLSNLYSADWALFFNLLSVRLNFLMSEFSQGKDSQVELLCIWVICILQIGIFFLLSI